MIKLAVRVEVVAVRREVSDELRRLLEVPMPVPGEESVDAGTARYLLKLERERRQQRLDKEGLRRRARVLRICALSWCDAVLVKRSMECWHDYLHRQTCCVEHRDLRRTEVAAIRRRAIAEQESTNDR